MGKMSLREPLKETTNCSEHKIITTNIKKTSEDKKTVSEAKKVTPQETQEALVEIPKGPIKIL